MMENKENERGSKRNVQRGVVENVFLPILGENVFNGVENGFPSQVLHFNILHQTKQCKIGK